MIQTGRQDEIEPSRENARCALDQANDQLRDGELLAAAISISVAAELQGDRILQTLAAWARQLAMIAEDRGAFNE